MRAFEAGRCKGNYHIFQYDGREGWVHTHTVPTMSLVLWFMRFFERRGETAEFLAF